MLWLGPKGRVKKMDPDLNQDIEGSLDGVGTTGDVPTGADVTSEVRMPETTAHAETLSHRDDTDDLSGVINPAKILVKQRPAESNLCAAADGDGTANIPSCSSTSVVQGHRLPSQQVFDDQLQSDGQLSPEAPARSSDTVSPPLAAGGGDPIIDNRDAYPEEAPTADPGIVGAVHSPNNSTAPKVAVSQVYSASQGGSRSNSIEADSGGTDGEERSSTEGKHNNWPEMGSKGDARGSGGRAGHPNDLPTQLNRIWGASPPGRVEGLAVMREMLGYRDELDGILSRLVAAKV